MQYVIHFGVQVDVQVPEEDRRMLREQWEAWKNGSAGENGCYTSIQNINLLTRYEHFALGSGVGLPPDPFKPLALQHEGANLEEVIGARRRFLPPTEEYQGLIYPALVPDFELLTGLKPFSRGHLAATRPDINEQGRIAIPKIVAVYDEDRKISVSDEIMARLQLPTSREDLTLPSGAVVREVFDYDNGYRIELVTSPK